MRIFLIFFISVVFFSFLFGYEEYGVFFIPELKMVQGNNTIETLFGGRAITFIENFSFGFGAYKAPFKLLGYAGLDLGYQFKPWDFMDIHLHGLVGYGTGGFYMEPSVSVLYNPFPFLRVGINLGYVVVSGLGYLGLKTDWENENALRGISFGIQVSGGISTPVK